ncbi:hypothetical protein [Alkaliphilus peptidifermentans]|uniref:ABC-2 family transporter protein n=1 Tax=Alkaliphilus peptidifermentans DSM 18978 TaxID=1120976 RepID=A0A1G5L0H7_9FIRM|nr:hypothetical protein [Alkaliphilus peptidifermentans]SCZ06372.1 hypothetical protein SAMN03080606_03942 [Alkaliphilus peptidifermentans DSM 18978]
MLKKLLKYEVQATSRIILPLYAALISLAIVNRVISSIPILTWHAPQIISMIIYNMILIGMFIMTFVMMIQRFYKNLLSDEGYLMFTLPIKSWMHIASKLLISMMWMVTSGIVALISIFIIAFDIIITKEFLHASVVFIGDFFRYFGPLSGLFIFEILLVGVVGLASMVLMIYASIAIGHLFNRHKILASVGSYIVLTTISQILFIIMAVISSYLPTPRHLSIANDLHGVEPIIHYVLWFVIIFSGILTSGYFILTNYILSKRLNLE